MKRSRAIAVIGGFLSLVSISKAEAGAVWSRLISDLDAAPAPAALTARTVADLSQHITGAPQSPAVAEAILGGPQGDYRMVVTRRPDGLVVETSNGADTLYDPSGAMVHVDQAADRQKTTVTLSQAIDLSRVGWSVQIETVGLSADSGSSDSNDGSRRTTTCTYSQAEARKITSSCRYVEIWGCENPSGFKREFKDNPSYFTLCDETPKTTDYTSVLVFQTDMGIYVSADAKIVDLKTADGHWRSEAVSAALSPEARDQAHGLFARGFDLYKAGDFSGAEVLIHRGLGIDPANHLAYFTLGDIARSRLATSGNSGNYAAVAKFSYQRVIDLAPTSDEAALAQIYLKKLG